MDMQLANCPVVENSVHYWSSQSQKVFSLHLLVHGSHLGWQRWESVGRQVELG